MEGAYVLVGSGGRIGAALEEKISRDGELVLSLDNSFSGMTQVRDRLYRFGFDALSRQDFEDFEQFLEERQLFVRGLVHLVAANQPPASLPEPNPYDPEKICVDTFIDEVHTNLVSAARMLRHLVRFCQAGSSIVLVSSDLGVKAPNPQLYEELGARVFKSPAYTSAKHALIGLSRHFAVHLAPRGIRVNSVAPGPVGPLPKKEFETKVAASIPMGRTAKAAEIASVVGFLLSDDSSFVNGETLHCDGGRTVW